MNDYNLMISLLEELIAIPSVSSDIVELENVIDFAQNYFSSTKLSVKKFVSNGYPSLLISKNPQTKFRLILNAHLDVVPAAEQMFALQMKENIATGRGVFDMKGAAAVMMTLFKDLSQGDKLPEDVALMLVSEEEI